MSIPHEETVKRVLAKNSRDMRIRACLEKAWEGVKEKYPDRPKWRRKSTTRALMWEDSVDAVLSALEADAGIKLVGHHDTFSFIADDAVLFRLKKAASNLFSSNFPTPLASLFHVHREDLFGHQGHQRVEIVHVFNRFQTALEWIGVVAREKNRILWQFELPHGESNVEVFPAPVTPLRPAASTVLRPAARENDKKNDADEK